MDSEDMTTVEAASLLGVSRVAVLRLVQRGTLPARRIGPLHVLRREDVLAYRDGRIPRQKPGPKPGTRAQGEQ